MSHIPSSAMPHAGPHTSETTSDQSGQSKQSSNKQDSQSSGVGGTISAQAGKLADYARENPKTAAAAGVAIVGAIAAAAIPLVRGLGSDDKTGDKTATSKKTKQGA
ncbi:MAG TPA: hypothetical protein VGC35_04030 [Allosphingosinicella sp.]|jgi:hypothetical protein